MEAVLASCTVFGRDIEYLFPGIQENIEGRIKKAARKLRTKVEKVHGATAEKKLALLDRIETQDGIPCK